MTGRIGAGRTTGERSFSSLFPTSASRTWIGRLPADGDYRIEVVRLARGEPSRLPYLIVVSTR